MVISRNLRGADVVRIFRASEDAALADAAEIASQLPAPNEVLVAKVVWRSR